MINKKRRNDERSSSQLFSKLRQLRLEDPPANPPRPADADSTEQPPADATPVSALSLLCSIWAPQAGLDLSLSQSLPEGLLTQEELAKEQERLQSALEQVAERRLDTLGTLRTQLAKQQQEPEEEPVEPEKQVEPAPVPMPPMPAECYVHSAQNGMAAWGLLFPPVGDGPELDLMEFGKQLGQSHITTGIDTTAVSQLITQKQYFTLYLLAQGTPVQEGMDGSVNEHFPRQRPQGIQTDETGRVDFRAQQYVHTVDVGDVICDILPPVPGAPGMRVDGIMVNPRPVKPAKPPKGSNTSVNSEGTALVATMCGHVEYSGSVFQVKPKLDIPGNVDYSSGNIDFRGDVHVGGDVRENFSIRATGTVIVDGLVEGATIEAGGDIIVANGVLGDNKALLKSKGSVRARYLENCVVYSGDCTYAECIMASRIFSDNRICVTSGRGTVIGGGLTAAASIQASIIGTKSGRETEIILGVLPYVQEEMRNIDIDRQAIQKELEELDRQLRYIENRQGIAGSSDPLAKGRLRKSVLVMKEAKLAQRRQELESKRPNLSQCRLECGTVYPATRLTIGSAFRVIDQLWTKCTAVYDLERCEIKFV